MLTANLLPESEQKHAALDGYRRLIELFSAIVVALFALGAVVLLPVYLPLALEARELKRAQAIEENAADRFAIALVIEELRQIKREGGAIELVLEKTGRASALAEFFFQKHAVLITSFIVSGDGALALSGFAKTRRDLLDFEKTLRESDRFEEISLPLSSITRETDISFTMRGALKSPYRL